MDVKIVIDKFGGEKQMSRRMIIANTVLLVYGIFLMIFPASALNLSVALVGIVMIAAGIICGVIFFLNKDEGNYPLLVVAVAGLIVGILVMFFRSSIALVLFPVLLGLWTFCTAVLAAIAAYGYYKANNGLWWVPLLGAIVALVVTVMVFLNLSGTERFMARILGIYFITYNIIRIGEYGATRMFPTPVMGGKSHRRKKERSAAKSNDEVKMYDYDRFDDGNDPEDKEDSDYESYKSYRDYEYREERY
ncbi:MAG TPA: DUF308 domain-containing protein [Clostridiales bacterium]|nr:DUF308 domain-containing protein [Clostridiales bacterium]